MRKTITHHEREWIKYRLALKNLTQVDIAALAGCTSPMVSNVIAGRKVSANVSMALVKELGYKSFDELIAACHKEAQHEGR
jgi:predicted transcriptional regulator